MAIRIEHENTLRAAIAKPVNLFLGAGFSCYATNKDGEPLPIGDNLRDELVAAFDVPSYKDLPLARLCRILEKTKKEQLRSFFVSRFTVTGADPAYEVLKTFR